MPPSRSGRWANRKWLRSPRSDMSGRSEQLSGTETTVVVSQPKVILNGLLDLWDRLRREEPNAQKAFNQIRDALDAANENFALWLQIEELKPEGELPPRPSRRNPTEPESWTTEFPLIEMSPEELSRQYVAAIMALAEHNPGVPLGSIQNAVWIVMRAQARRISPLDERSSVHPGLFDLANRWASRP